ncbi:MAG: DUF1598 domain-containing protein [Thermoguttaceae bacterium]|nr:DUF1598 domain-containing protein [Thermoguttaceae bacterium]MDW8077561.1 DUF1598 domain-containing protein [Thermoguttaceae bacterium]
MKFSAIHLGVVKVLFAVAVVLAASLAGTCTFAQQYLNARAVGGVVVDAQGMLTKAEAVDLQELERLQKHELGRAVAQEMAAKVPLRKVSLSRINQLLKESLAQGLGIPPEVYCLGGLQDILYVIADPDKKDILLVGPAEAWKAGPNGVLVGQTSGRAVMLLDDLVVALRSLSSPRPEVISCSINPRSETIPALQQFTRRIPRGVSAEVVARELEQILGPQAVSISGVPEDSHFARVMVAADYRMKRLGLGLDRSPVPGLPPFTAFVRAQAAGMMPRWWLVPEVSQISRDNEGLVWEISELRVKTLTETEFVSTRQGETKASGNVPGTERWAEAMTQKYEELAQVDPVFDQLRNCMELAIVAAIIVSHKLPQRVGADLSCLMDENGIERARVQPARYVPTQSVIAPLSRVSLVACGGVEINPWAIIQQSQKKEDLGQLRSQLALGGQSWWGN